jgi:hypothetical protein
MKRRWGYGERGGVGVWGRLERLLKPKVMLAFAAVLPLPTPHSRNNSIQKEIVKIPTS